MSSAWAERASPYEKFSNSFVSLGMFAVLQSVLALVIIVFFSRELLKFTPMELPGEIFDRYGIGLLIGIAALFASHAIAFIKDYVLALEYKHSDVQEMSTKPIASVALMQVAILTGGGFLTAVNSPLMGLVLLVLAKTTADVFSYLKTYREYSLKDYYSVVT